MQQHDRPTGNHLISTSCSKPVGYKNNMNSHASCRITRSIVSAVQPLPSSTGLFKEISWKTAAAAHLENVDNFSQTPQLTTSMPTLQYLTPSPAPWLCSNPAHPEPTGSSYTDLPAAHTWLNSPLHHSCCCSNIAMAREGPLFAFRHMQLVLDCLQGNQSRGQGSSNKHQASPYTQAVNQTHIMNTG